MFDQDSEAKWVAEPARLAAARQTAGRSRLARTLMPLYRVRRLRKLVLRVCRRLEGGPFFSSTLRQILARFHDVEVGAYSYGDVLKPGLLPPGSRVGRYVSSAEGLLVLRRNHPIDRLSQHPFFYNALLGFLREDTTATEAENPLEIGHDVWIGARVMILPGCRRIGNGAVIAAGAAVACDVAPYTVVGGVPARPMRQRFERSIAEAVERTRWWEHELDHLLANPPATLTVPLTPGFPDLP